MRLAIPKGRLSGPTLTFLTNLGLATETSLGGRGLVIETATGDHLLIARSSDIPLLVEHGAADAGICGSDVLHESGLCLRMSDALPFGRCRLVLAAQDASALCREGTRVATSYPRLATSYLEAAGYEASIIAMHGSVELAPQAGIADAIIDITETGTTLRDNGLRIVAEVLSCSARIVVKNQIPALFRSFFQGGSSCNCANKLVTCSA